MVSTSSVPRTRLEQLVGQLRRTNAEFCRDFEAISAELGRKLAVSERQTTRSMAGKINGLPHPAACRVLERMFGERAERLFGPPDPVPRAEITRTTPPCPTPTTTNGSPNITAQREVAMAAAESSRFGQFAEQSNVGPHTLEQFRADITRIATTYPNRPVHPAFAEVRELRNRAFDLLEGRQHPEQSRELYLVTGVLCGVLANASFDLGFLHAAETQARTAFLCAELAELAELAGNNALRAWVRGTQSLVAYWDGRLRAAVELAADGWRYPPETGTARVRLAAIEARAHGRLHDQRATEDALARAEQARAEILGEDEPGGMLAFPIAKQTWYAATTRLWLGSQANLSRAEQDVSSAIQVYETDAPEDRRLGELCLARLDLASVRLGRDDLEGMAVQIQDVLTVASQRRTDSVVRRLSQVAIALERPRLQTSTPALDLHDEIRDFTHHSTAPALPGSAT
ncbi:MAG: hypothetical protein JO063_06815 [Pseudonocardiales bacterium]|nr:hypothetical protein [Pseudonocardiales bacterium]MBV9030376.1 hypothetical protein [Pseudonocardiales bacterium]MBW0009815.1 hypothetical protein [Pseudonocardiales bacterium]